MAVLELDAEHLHLKLSRLERLAGLHGDIDVPRSSVRGVEAIADPWPDLRGIRAPGTGIPSVLMIGTTRWRGQRDFCVVRGHGPAVIVALGDFKFSRLIISTPEAYTVAENLRSTLGC
jgi:hypothetical protein